MKDSEIKALVERVIREEIEDNNTFLIANMKEISQHIEPSPVTREILKRHEEWMREIKTDNKDADREILNKLEEIKVNQRVGMEDITKKMDEKYKEIHDRVKTIEDWKLVFTAKMTVYSSLAIILGTAIGQLILSIFKNYIF